MTIGQWLGKIAGNWLGATGEADPNAMVGSASFSISATATLTDQEQPQLATAGGGKLNPRKKIKPRPAWLKPVAWALEDEENIQPDIVVADVALMARKRRQREEQELLLMRAI